MTAALIVLSCLCLALTVTLFCLVLTQNRTSRTPSPTPSTTPIPSSDGAMSMMKMMQENFDTALRETRELVVTLVQGRERPPETGPTEMPPMPNARLSGYDYDSTPLSSGIEAILAREAEENALAASLQERQLLIDRMNVLQGEMDRMRSQSNGSSA